MSFIFAINNFFFVTHQAVAFLNSNELEAEVNQLCDKARAMGITGVPVIVIDGKWAVKGGHSSEVFVQVRSFYNRSPKFRGIYDIFRSFRSLRFVAAV